MPSPVPPNLSPFSMEQLRAELMARGAPFHAGIAAVLSDAKQDLAGDVALSQFSSNDLLKELKERQKSIYGVDNRKDLFEVTDEAPLGNADSVVALFRSSRVRDNNDGTSTLQVGEFGAINSLCPTETFFKQPVGAFCTGFLVAPDIIATAGHCVNEGNATTVRFVFGFRMTDAATAQVRISSRDIYSGVSVVARKLTDESSDWCLVRLDRPVDSRRILKLRRSGKIANEQGVYVIGHPSGLPAKFANGANVRINEQAAFFTANLDTYGGNSGSPVFNAATHEVEGILVRGATDFVPLGMCMVSAVCPTNGCQGEDCTRVSEFLPHLP